MGTLYIPRDLGYKSSLDSLKMTLAKMPNSGDIETEETSSSVKTLLQVEGWGHQATFKILNQKYFCQGEMQ